MRFLFIYPSPGVLGGIETLLVRMSRWLVAKGHQVSLLIESPGEWTGLLPEGVECVALGKRYRKLYYYYHAKRLWESLGIPKPDVIKSFDLPSSWMACQLADLTGNTCKVIAGIYNPFVFKWYYSTERLARWDDNRLYLRNYLKRIPASARLFCGTDQIEELAEVHHEEGMLWPLPIDRNEFEPASRKPKWGKIVSVGRLSPMKEYNLYMIDVVRDLIKMGHKVTWSVYGAGEYEGEMGARIQKHSLEGVISMEGKVPYRRFWQVLEDAYVFVGMGTAVLEASLFKVPNVNAVAYDREGVTHGAIYRFPPGSIAPGSSCPPNLKVVDEIERILRLSAAEYRAEEERVYGHVQEHEMESSMGRLLELVRTAEPIASGKARYLANYPLWFMRKAMKLCGKEPVLGHPNAPPASAGAKACG